MANNLIKRLAIPLIVGSLAFGCSNNSEKFCLNGKYYDLEKATKPEKEMVLSAYSDPQGFYTSLSDDDKKGFYNFCVKNNSPTTSETLRNGDWLFMYISEKTGKFQPVK